MIGRSYYWLALFDVTIECVVNFPNGWQQETLKKLMRHHFSRCSFCVNFNGSIDYFYCAIGIWTYYLKGSNERSFIFCLDMIFHFLNL